MYKLSIARSLFKEAFKNCSLRIGQTEEGEFYVAGKDWIMWFGEGTMEKEIKGELISLCGDFPDPGTAYLALPEEGQQMEILRDDFVPHITRQARSYNAAPFFYKKGKKIGSVLWSQESAALCIIDNRVLGLIVEEGEESITGPVGADRFICWYKAGKTFCALIWPRGEDDDEAERFLRALETGWLS